MMPSPEPLSHLDKVLATRICRWLNTDDTILWHSVALVSYALAQGHSCLALDKAIAEEPYSELLAPINSADEWLAALQAHAMAAQDNAPVVLENRRLYLRRYWLFEQELADFFLHRFQQSSGLDKNKWPLAKQLLTQYFPTKTDETDWQRVAAMNCLLNNTSLIIGGPGTGKTYTVTRILALLASLAADHPPVIKLAAPTGKAAQRLAEAISLAKAELPLDFLVADCIPDSAQTLHRLLGVIPEQIQFRHNEHNPIHADVLLIDEVSMVDLPLMARLSRAISPDTQLILLGDADQLPSVAAGSVLADLVTRPHPGYSQQRINQLKKLDNTIALTTSSNPVDYVTELVKSRRFDSGSGIGQLAKKIIHGQTDSESVFSQFDELNWYSDDQFDALLRQWTTEYYQPIAGQSSLADAFAQLKTFRILCATKEDERGVNAINQRIEKRLNLTRQPFYKGQPIMVTQNHYHLQLFNGDIGIVWPDQNNTLMAWFEQGHDYRAVALGRLPATESVYAMTIHKTQGSEFSHVAMVLPQAGSQLLTRELLYTGLTRAKKQFSCIGKKSVWERGIRTQVARWSGLADALSTRH